MENEPWTDFIASPIGVYLYLWTSTPSPPSYWTPLSSLFGRALFGHRFRQVLCWCNNKAQFTKRKYVAVTLFGAYHKQIIKPSTYVATLHCKVDLLHVHIVHNTTTNVRMLSTHESLRELPNLSAARQLQNQAHSVEEESIKHYKTIDYPPTPAFAKAGAAPGTTGGVEPALS